MDKTEQKIRDEAARIMEHVSVNDSMSIQTGLRFALAMGYRIALEDWANKSLVTLAMDDDELQEYLKS